MSESLNPAPGPGRLRSLALLAAASFLAVFLWLRNEHLLLPQAGQQAVLAANALLEGRGLELDPGVPFSKYPPLYPLLLAPLEWLRMDVVPAVYAVNGATLALTLCALYALARVMGSRRAWIAPVAWALLGSSHYLLRAARGDAIPIAMSLLLVLALVEYGRNGSRRALLLAALACAVAGLARYMALFTVIPIGLAGACWLAWRRAGARSAWRHGALFALVAGIPPGLWLLRNQLVKGFVFGIPKVSEARAGAAGTTLGNNVRGILETMLVDLFGYDALGVIRVVHGDAPVAWPWAMGLGALVALALVVVMALHWRRSGKPWLVARIDGADPRATARVLLLAFALLYLAGLVVIWTVGQNDPIHTRYLAPLYAPLLVLLLDLAEGPTDARGPANRWTLLGIGLLVLVPNASKSAQLLGETPDERLLELTSRRGANRWHADLTWDLRGGGAMED